MVGHDKTRLLSRRKYACCDKVMFDATNALSRQICVCIIFVTTNKHNFVCLYAKAFKIMFICRDKTFVATKIFCRDKDVFVATKVKTFVATKMILAAAPANR